MEYIYRDYHLPRLSSKACADLLQGLALSGGSIVSSGCLNNGFPENKVGFWEGFYKLRFSTQAQLDKFHSLGLKTERPETISGQ